MHSDVHLSAFFFRCQCRCPLLRDATYHGHLHMGQLHGSQAWHFLVTLVAHAPPRYLNGLEPHPRDVLFCIVLYHAARCTNVFEAVAPKSKLGMS